MGVYVKGMEMPTQCYDCYIVANDPDSGKLYCKHLDTDIENWEGILPDCPLVEIATPHGSLVDRKAYWDETDKHEWYCKDDELARAFAILAELPEVLPGEGE